MSQDYYQQQWREAQDELKKSIAAEAKLRKKGPIKDLNTAKWVVGHLFIRYVRIVNTLDDCYDQMVHPQKREVIGRLLDMSLGRLLELKSEIVRLEKDDYCFFDNVLIELKLTHQDLEIHVPKYFWKDREKEKAHRRDLIRQVFEEAERENFRAQFLESIPEEEREAAWEKHLAKEEQQRLEREKFEEQQRKMQVHTGRSKDSLDMLKAELKKESEVNMEEIIRAVELIQRHERARQGRILAMLANRRKMLIRRGELGLKLPEKIAENAAKVIQRHWRRHRWRMKEAKAKERLKEMLDMTLTSFKDKNKYKKLDKVSKIRKKIQERNQAEYEQALVAVKEKMRKWYSVTMEEDIVDELIGWFQWYFEQCNFLPEFPPEKPVIPTGEVMGIPKKLGPEFAAKLYSQKKSEGQKGQKMTALGIALAGITALGGSALVVAGHWIAPREFAICQKELEKRKKAGNEETKDGGKDKMSKQDKKALQKKLKEEEKRRQLAEEAEGFRLRESNFVVPLSKADRDYRVIWMDRDESQNKEQRYVYEFVKDDKCYELSLEVRKVADEMMALELDLLKEALERDKNPKKKPKKRKPKKGKKAKKKKGKKDPTGDRTLDDLFMELFRNGIIRDYNEAFLKDYMGERSFGAFDMRQRLIDWPPSTGDVRELILQLCILPLGSTRIHQLSPLTKGICLLGTENSGKEFLARIICTETAAVMFDLTPTNIAGKYPGKDGLKMLQHLVEKMSRALQPSVIFVDGAEKTFYKKVPKEEKELEPKRLAKMITKTAKGIKPEDQVLLLGVSSQPWMAKKSAFLKTYDKTIQVPQMDYGSYMKLWQGLLSSYHSIPGDFDVSCLARVSDGFSVKTIMDVVKKVMTTERISRSRHQPFTPGEFFQELLRTTPTDEKLKEKSLKFYGGLELPKKRAALLMELREELEKSQKKK